MDEPLNNDGQDDFFTDLDEIYAGFFGDLDEMQAEIDRAEARAAHKRKMFLKNSRKGRHILRRLQFVRDFDIWRTKVGQIDEDEGFWKYEDIKILGNKRARLEWILLSLYRYWMFDDNPHFIDVKRFTFTKQRRLYDLFLRRAKKRRDETGSYTNYAGTATSQKHRDG